jgi:hypothetical protein
MSFLYFETYVISITRNIVFQLSASNSFRYLQTTVKFLYIYIFVLIKLLIKLLISENDILRISTSLSTMFISDSSQPAALHFCRTTSTTYGQKYRFMFQRIKFLQNVIRNKSEDKRRHVGYG